MKVPIVTCPKCKAQLDVVISDKDLILMLLKKLGCNEDFIKTVE